MFVLKVFTFKADQVINFKITILKLYVRTKFKTKSDRLEINCCEKKYLHLLIEFCRHFYCTIFIKIAIFGKIFHYR